MNVIRIWAEDLTYEEQATLLLALRGPDGIPKSDPIWRVCEAVQGCVLISKEDTLPDVELINTGHYYVGYLKCLLDAAKIISGNHPVDRVARFFRDFCREVA